MLADLSGKKGLVVGVANDQSIAWGAARAFHEGGAALALTWLNDKARPHVQPLAEQIDSSILAPLDVTQPGQMKSLFERVRAA